MISLSDFIKWFHAYGTLKGLCVKSSSETRFYPYRRNQVMLVYAVAHTPDVISLQWFHCSDFFMQILKGELDSDCSRHIHVWNEITVCDFCIVISAGMFEIKLPYSCKAVQWLCWLQQYSDWSCHIHIWNEFTVQLTVANSTWQITCTGNISCFIHIPAVF